MPSKEPAQSSIDLRTCSIEDTATANDSPRSTAAQSSPDIEILLPEDFRSSQLRDSAVEKFSDSSASHHLDEENGSNEGKNETHATFRDKAKKIFG